MKHMEKDHDVLSKRKLIAIEKEIKKTQWKFQFYWFNQIYRAKNSLNYPLVIVYKYANKAMNLKSYPVNYFFSTTSYF